MESSKPAILVLCTGNSARSQIAAAYLARYLGDRFDVLSAGSEPAERIHPLAIEVMREEGIAIAGEPTDLGEYLDTLSPRYVIVVCENAARACPVWPGPTERLFWPFDDPAAARGDRDRQLQTFREIRDRIHARIREWAAGLDETGAGAPRA